MNARPYKGPDRPSNPAIGQLYYEPVSRTMRKWDGQKWAELSKEQVGQAVKDSVKRTRERINGK